MKILRPLVFVCVVVIMQSCYDPGGIRIQNNISSVTLTNVKWGDVYIASELLPGETSLKRTITSDEQKLPASRTITFIMKANNQSIYLETEQKYLICENDDLLIELNDATFVKNPNK